MGYRKVAGLIASLVGASLLASCASGGGAQSEAPSGAPSSEGADIRTGEQYDARAFEGSSIKLLLIEHPFVSTLEPLLPEFEAETGIAVEYEVFSEQQGFDKMQADLSSRSGNYDIVMTDPLHNWQYAAAGWLEPLEDYIKNDAITMPEYDVDDFVPGIFDAGKWNLQLGEGIGEGSTWALPINFESYNLAYRPSIFEEAGIAVPETYEDVLDATLQLSEHMEGNNYPVVTRFDRYWDLTFLTWACMAQSYGVYLVDDEGNVSIDTPEGVEAANLFIEIIKAGSPDDAAAFTWYETLQGMASGRFAMALNEADLFAATYENPAESEIYDDVGYALVPEGPNGRETGAWVWQISMNSAAQDKGATWMFMQWLTSPETLLKTNIAGNMNPVRESAWANEELSEIVESWGATPGQYREVLQDTADIAAIRFPPHPELTRALDVWAEALQASYFDGNTEEHLEKAALEIQSILD